MSYLKEAANPRIPRKKGQPANSKKHSDLYTDENPKGTIHGLGFKDVATAKASVSKIRKSSRSHAHKIQAAVAMEQRAREMGKTAEAAIYRKFINSMKKKTQKMNEGKSHGDHEHEMIRRQTSSLMNAAKRIKKKVGKGEGDVKAWVQSKITKATDYIDTAADYMDSKDIKDEFLPEILDKKDVPHVKKLIGKLRSGSKTHAKQADDLEKAMNEGSLHKWFKGSKSKDGKGGWVNVVTGGTCASDEPGEGTPKCVSSAKRARMTKKERLSAARRKKRADPNQQSKSGAAKPTYVRTDKKKKKVLDERHYGSTVNKIPKELDKAVALHASQAKRLRASDEFKKDAGETANKIPGQLDKAVTMHKKQAKQLRAAGVGDKNCGCGQTPCKTYGKKKMKEELSHSRPNLNEKCWKGYKKKGMKTMFGKRYPNCVKESDLNLIWEKARKKSADKTVKRWWDDDGDGIGYEKGEVKEGYGKKKKKHNCASKVKHEEFGIGDCIKGMHTLDENNVVTHYDVEFEEYIVENCPVEDLEILISEMHEHYENEEKNAEVFNVSEEGKSLFSTPQLDKLKKLKDYKSNADKVFKRKETDKAHYEPEGETISEVKDKKGKGSGTKDACYHKVKSRYSVWPSAYASGALVKCRKKGAANWGNSRKEEVEYEVNENRVGYPDMSPEAQNRRKEKRKELITRDMKYKATRGEHYSWKDNFEFVKEGAAWTKKEGKNKSGGLNEKGRKSYERENPGSDLKRPSKKVGNKRRASFCARMKGMKKKLTSKKTANDPDSRINKSLRAWNC